MATTTITSKGQMTLPKDVRDRLGLKTGDRLEVSVDGHRIVLVPKTLHLDDIISLLPRPSRKVSVAQMNETIARAGAGAGKKAK